MKAFGAGSHVRNAVVAGLLTMMSSFCRIARAQGPDDAVASAPLASVHVRLVGALGNDAVLKQRIASWFEPARFSVSVRSVTHLEPQQVLAPTHGASVQAWVTRRSDKLARLYFASQDPDTAKTRYLLRDLRLESGLDELGSEALAEAVHLSAVALLEGQLTTSREQVEQSLQGEPASSAASVAVAPVTAPSSSTPSIRPAAPTAAGTHGDTPRSSANHHPEVVAALGYAVDLRGDEGVGQGPRVRLRVASSSGWGALVRLQLALPEQRQLPQLDLNLFGGAALLAASFRAHVSRLVVVEGFVGPDLAWVRYTARARAGSNFEPSPTADEWRPRLVFGVLFGFGASPRLALVPQLAVSAGQTNYEMERAGKREIVARATRLTPGLGLELEL